MDLEGKAVLISGAARGIGRAIAIGVAQAGANVAVADIREDLAAETAVAVESCGRRALVLTVDVTSKSDVERMVREVVDAYGRIDVFYANAGIISISEFLEASEDDWDTIMDVNAKGVFLCGQAVARQMLSQGWDAAGGQSPFKIINTASIAARMGVPDSAAYGASKAAVVSLTRSMALAFAGRGINVNALAPGMVDTDMWDLIDEQTARMRGMERGEPRRRRARRIPIGRPGVPSDIAKVAVFLASSASDYMTGQTLNIDGGNVLS